MAGFSKRRPLDEVFKPSKRSKRSSSRDATPVEGVRPPRGSRQFRVPPDSRFSEGAGDKVSGRQFASSKKRWSADEERSLSEAVDAGKSMEEIGKDVLSHRGYDACRARYAYMQKKARRSSGNNESAPVESEHAGTMGDQQQPAALPSSSRVAAPAEQPAPRAAAPRLPTLTAGQSRLFTKAPQSARSGSGAVHHVFQYHSHSQGDFSNLVQTVSDYRFCMESLNAYRGAKGDTSSISLLTFADVFVMWWNDGVAEVAPANGKMRHGMPPPLRRSLAWLADLSWSKEEREEFAQMSPFERYHASSTALDWTWTSQDTLVLPVDCHCAEPLPSAGDGTYVVQVQFPSQQWKDAVEGNAEGPLIVVFLPEEVVVTHLHDVVFCSREGNVGTGGYCKRKSASKGVHKFEWTFPTRSDKYKKWAATRSLPLDEHVSERLRQKVLDRYEDASEDMATGIALVKWGEEYEKMVQFY